ncbi:MAG TPA: hypothetical protein VFW71_06105 [Actinomycetota bacterium]|nr:hypothetical protein [Actinomycetota bacterium]
MLRIETTINPKEFKVFRVAHTASGPTRRWCPMGKAVENTWRYHQEVQRVGVAGALPADRSILVLDEPTAQPRPDLDGEDQLRPGGAPCGGGRDPGMDHPPSRWLDSFDRAVILERGRIADA